jgi:hypothetical protein
MSRLALNRAPYFDDYGSDKNYLKILFKPGRPVQARELNQIQSISQNQIESFANHIFKNGSKVSNARGSFNAKSYVRLQPLSPWKTDVANPDGYPVDLTPFKPGMRVYGVTSGIPAIIVKTVEAENGDPPTLYIVYTGTAVDGKTKFFIPGEVIKFTDNNGIAVYSAKVKCPGCAGATIDPDTIAPCGQGQIFTIDEGIFYYEGMFIENARQDIVVSKYGEVANCKLGFDFVQTIVTSDDDMSLLDNALGYPNSTAPGADRYKVELVLTKRSLNQDDGENFILLATCINGAYRYLKTDSEYSDIMDMIAKRTYETNGNYTVSSFDLKFIEDKAESVGDPKGFSVTGDPDYVRAVVGPGVSYVRGYRFESLSDQFIQIKKARDTKKIASFIKRFEDRTYIQLRPLRSYSAYPNSVTTPLNTDATIVNVYDGVFNGGVPGGNLIGSFRVYDVMPVSGTINHATPASRAVFKYYIYDLNMIGTHKLSEGKSFVDSNQTHGFKAEPSTDNVTIYNPGKTELIWKLDRTNAKSLRSITDNNPNPPGSLTIILRKKMSKQLNSEGTATFESGTNEYFLPFDSTSTVAVLTAGDASAGLIYTIDLTGKCTATTTTLTVNLGTTIDVGLQNPISVSGNTITLIHNVMKTNAQEDPKVAAEVIKDNLSPTLSSILLGVTDAYQIEYVKQYNPNNLADEIDITSKFTLDTGLHDWGYKQSSVKAIAGTATPVDRKWRIKVKYFGHNNTGTMGFYTIDSYRDLLSSNVMSYDDGPVYTAVNKTEYPLFSCFDFRPNILGGVFSGTSIPAINSTSIFDLEYYLGRIDLLCVNKEGIIYSKKGIPSDDPTPPKMDENAMSLYEIHFKPYTYSTNDISVRYIENKRYTMRDIGRIEERVKNIEYYTALNLLEKSAQDMSIKDANGLDRFKNGFVADNFKDYQAADILSSDFRAALDRKSRELRPSFKARNKKLKLLVGNSDAIYRGKMAMIDYDSVMVDEQPYATKSLSINPAFQFRKMGEMVLMPNNDVWSDVTRLPNLTVKIDTGVEALNQVAKAAGVFNTEWGSWAETNRTIVSVDKRDVGSNKYHPEQGNVTLVTTTSGVTQTRTGTSRSVESRTDAYDLGDRVTDVSIQPYMRSTSMAFFATKMKKNTDVWAFFDKKPVTEWTRSLMGSPGEQLRTDAAGQIAGIFNCPAGMFFTGDRELYLTNDEKLTGDPDEESTAASAKFFSGGLKVTKQQTTLNVVTPVLKTTTVSESRSVTETVLTAEGLPYVPCPACGWCEGCQDPVAQSFKLKRDYFITGFDVYFKEIDPNPDEVFFQIRNMVNGYPGQQILGEQRHLTKDLTHSKDSTVPFHVEFKFPIFVLGNVEYCFVVGGFSPDTRIWVSKLGGTVVNIPGKIVETQPAIGSSFRSQNASTWNAEQYEDIKYKIYVAKFKKRTMALKFEHIPERILLGRDPFEAEAGRPVIRVMAEDHGFNANDKVTLSMFEHTWIEVSVTSGQLRVGQRVVSGAFSATIKDIKTTQAVTSVLLGDCSGSFVANALWTCQQIDWEVHDNFLVENMGFSSANLQAGGKVRFNAVAGKFNTAYPASINGIPIAQLSKQHIIQTVDSMDSFIIPISVNATESGRFGGEDVYAQVNEKYEIFNLTGAYLPYKAQELWTYKGIGHNPINSVFAGADYTPMEPKAIVLGTDNHLGQPHKMICEDNRSSGGRMVTLDVAFTATDEFLSPIVNTDTFSITTISNRVEWVTTAQFEIEPNASGRYIPEADPMNGSENYKYVTKTLNLKNPASDLMIAFDVYKDLYADFDVWVKVVAPYEGVDIDTKRWMRVLGIDKTHNSVDLQDRVELEITMSKMSVELYSDNTTFTVVKWDDLPQDEFSSFKVKIVGKAKNPAKPPLLQSLRCIAIT